MGKCPNFLTKDIYVQLRGIKQLYAVSNLWPKTLLFYGFWTLTLQKNYDRALGNCPIDLKIKKNIHKKSS